MPSYATTQGVRSLYRSLLREAGKLPYGYLRAFFRFKCRDDVHSVTRAIARNKKTVPVKMKKLSQDFRRLRAANEGSKLAFMRVLNLAYGRTGKLRWELLEPFRYSKTTEVPPPIIPGVEESRPPTFSKELTALLCSSISRSSDKGLTPDQLETPPSLRTRPDPSSEEVRLLGPISKRLQVNARWRFFAQELRRIKLPLQVDVSSVDSGVGEVKSFSGSERSARMKEFGLVGGGFQGTGLLESLQSMTSDIGQPCIPRRERVTLEKEETRPRNPGLPTRFLRRSHRGFLTDVPLLTCLHKKFTRNGQPRQSTSYSVTLTKQANSANLNHTSPRLHMIDNANMAWIQRAEEMEGRMESK